MAKILIIEDEEPVYAIMRRTITGMGHEVIHASDGRQGLEMAREDGISIITSDLQLPGEPTGMALIRRLRSIKPECPIIIVSGHPSQENMAECQQLGVTDFLTKPFEMTFVRSVIDGLLRSKSTDKPLQRAT